MRVWSELHARACCARHPLFVVVPHLVHGVCPVHGEFEQSAHGHLSGHGCPVCRPGNSSKKASQCLDSLEEIYNVNIQHIRYKTTNKVEKEYRILNMLG